MPLSLLVPMRKVEAVAAGAEIVAVDGEDIVIVLSPVPTYRGTGEPTCYRCGNGAMARTKGDPMICGTCFLSYQLRWT